MMSDVYNIRSITRYSSCPLVISLIILVIDFAGDSALRPVDLISKLCVSLFPYLVRNDI